MQYELKQSRYCLRMLQAGVCLLMILCVVLTACVPERALAASYGTVNCSSLNLRKKASKDSKALQTLDQGTTVEILGESGEWYKVTYGKYTGYVMKKYINKGKNSTSASKSSSSSSSAASLKSIGKPSPCSVGDGGSNVKKLQKCLKALGYYTGAIDGDYGSGTKSAVKKLQKAKGLKQTGNADKNTIAAMFGESVSSSSSSSTAKTYTTERLNWFKNGSSRIPKGSTFTVKDCKTGKTFQCKRWSGANHMDSEPLTKSDTATMKSIYGGTWSWKRRPILVKYDGRVYAASMNGMPHGTTTIDNNNFDGHFCIHFYGSKTHGTKKVDSTHQNCVSQAMKYTW
ncbi:MAG: peptidoglycan-binding protein [Clostridia bacterium]|nr:peptidoglycan-binding protein [Clostridia bacterium]